MTPGPVALVGSGEFLPVMEETDRALLDGRPPHIVHLATAAGPEGPEMHRYWAELAAKHAARIGATVDSLPVFDRAAATSGEFDRRIAAAGLVYLSGGNPGFLADCLRSTPVLAALVTAWRSGAALAGCSAGAMALTGRAPDVRPASGTGDNDGLNVVGTGVVLPHFDRLVPRRPGIVDVVRAERPGEVVIGIDEDTALVGGPSSWRVTGRQRVHLYEDQVTSVFEPGDEVLIQLRAPVPDSAPEQEPR